MLIEKKEILPMASHWKEHKEGHYKSRSVDKKRSSNYQLNSKVEAVITIF